MITMNLVHKLRFRDKVDVGWLNQCWPYRGVPNNSGYGMFGWAGKSRGAHVMSYVLCYGQVPDERIVCHICDLPICVNPFHVWDGTYKENLLDAQWKKRYRCNRVLTNEAIEEAKFLKEQGYSYSDIGFLMGCDRMTTYKAINGQSNAYFLQHGDSGGAVKQPVEYLVKGLDPVIYRNVVEAELIKEGHGLLFLKRFDFLLNQLKINSGADNSQIGEI